MSQSAAALALALLVAAPVTAATQDHQIWANVTAMGPISGKTIYFAEVQPRFAEGASHLSQLLLRGAVGYQLRPSFAVYAGYMHVALPIEHEPDHNEERAFIQTSWTLGKIGGGTLSNRTRFEHRTLSTGNDTGWRVRSMIRYVHPLGSPERPRALVSVEPFVALNDTDWGARSGFDQVRSFAGLEIPLKGGKSTIELGYLNQTVNSRGPVNRSNHVLSAALFIRH